MKRTWEADIEFEERYNVSDWATCPTCGGYCPTVVTGALRTAWRYCPRCKVETEERG